jgi:Cu2+-exporting ATPase
MTCFHCGTPAPSPVQGLVAGSERVFCCRGCLAVAEAIVETVGASWYEWRQGAPGMPPPRPEPLGPDLSALITTDGDLREATFAVDGMHCTACVWLLERAVGAVPGVRAVRVLLGPRRAKVAWTDGRTDLPAIAAAMAKVGYRARPIDPSEPPRPAAAGTWLRAGVAALGAMGAMWLEEPLLSEAVEPAVATALRLADALVAGSAGLYAMWPFLAGAWRSLRNRLPGMDLTMALGATALLGQAVWGAVKGAGSPDFMMLNLYLALLLAGRAAEESVRQRILSEAGRLLRESPTRIRVLRGDLAVLVDPADVDVGDTIEVRAGERIPADGVVIDGRCDVQDAVLTGEPALRTRAPGDRVVAGSVALDGRLAIRSTGRASDGAASRLARLAAEGAAQRTPLRAITDRAGAWGAIGMIGLAAIGAWVGGPGAATAALLVFCPCALGLAIPAALTIAGGSGIRRGFLVTGGAAFERLPDVDTVVLDKTGTVTAGALLLEAIYPADDQTDLTPAPASAAENRVLRVAAALAAGSDHPLSRAIRLVAEPLEVQPARDIRVVPGRGIEGRLGLVTIRLGKASWACPGVRPPATAHGLTLSAVTFGDQVIGWLAFGDRPAPEASSAVRDLHALGLHVVLATGDGPLAAAEVAIRLGIETVASEQTPEAKCAILEALRAEQHIVAMVGDGLNDAPALAAADVGIALGEGTDLARISADIILLKGIAALPAAIRQARRTRRIIAQNLAMAAAYNLICVPLALVGYITPLAAAILMPLSSLVVLGNAARLAR